MELIDGEYLELIQKCITFAREFMLLPDPIEAYFEECPSDRFKSMDNAAEGSGNKIFFNKPWFTGKDRWENHKCDIEFFIFHELRHLYQQYEILQMKNNKKIEEKIDTVVVWQSEFEHYIRNEGENTQKDNVSQEVEIDANAYAVCLCNLLHLTDNVELIFSVPEEAMDLAEPRSRQYYEARPELKRCMDKARREAGQLEMKKPQRNDPCPCGSGKKFKKCCIGKAIYD